MRVRTTELGVKGILLLAALELAFLATSYSNLFFLLIAFCGVLGGLGLWWSVANLRGLRLQLHEVPFAPAGTERPLQFELGLGRRTHHDLAVEILVGAAWTEVAYVSVATGTLRLEGTMPGLPRGVHKVAGMRVVTRFPFGFYSTCVDAPVAASLVTWPNPAAVSASGKDLGSSTTHQIAVVGRRSPTVAGLRLFRSGDAIADVHWKASARRGTAIVKEREVERGTALDVVIDRRCEAPDLEGALATTAGLLLAVRCHERPLRIRSQDCSLEVGANRSGEHEALRWLAAATTLPRTAPCAPAGSTGSLRLPAQPRDEVPDG